jgi:hypothetical protein
VHERAIARTVRSCHARRLFPPAPRPRPLLRAGLALPAHRACRPL